MGNYVSQERRSPELGYLTTRAFSQATGVHEKTLGKLENGIPVGRNTIAAVEIALSWAPGSADAIRAGGEPKRLSRDHRTPSAARAKIRAMSHPELVETAELIGEVFGTDEAERWLQGALRLRTGARPATRAEDTITEKRDRNAG